MTIFLNALKKLMKDELSELVVTLLSRTESYSASFHNPDLSHEQLEKIIALDSDIVHFKSTGNDGDDVKKITELVNCTLNDIRDIRSRHRASRDDGDTVTCLNNLRMQIPAFYKKIEDVRFDATSPSYLLNKLYTKTPEHIVYYHGICYLGDGIFNAKSGGDADIRTAKEESVKTRFNQINGEMKPEYDLQNQLTRIFRYLTDLHRDNEDAIKQDESSLPFALPSIKLLNVLSLSAPIEWFSPGLGNLAKEFNMALRKIVAIQTDDFGKPDELVGSFEKQTSSLFLLVLKKQYKIVLSRLIKNLRDQIDTHYGYDADLSKDQHEQIILLDAQLDSFQGTGNDANDVATLMHLIDVGLSKSQDIRKSHKKYPDEGNTITNLYNLRNHSYDFLSRMNSLVFQFKKADGSFGVKKLDLLNKPFSCTPEYYVYYHACCCFANECFNPGVEKSVEKKENSLISRLVDMSQLIQGSEDQNDQQERTLTALNIVLQDLKPLCKKGWFGSLFGASSSASSERPELKFPVELGYLARELNAALQKINGLANDTHLLKKNESVASCSYSS